MRIILYQSSTGTTERYAKLLAERTGLPCQSLEKSTAPADAEVIFLGWLMGDSLQGLQSVKARYANLVAVGAVGLFSMSKPRAELEAKIAAGAPLFLLPGSFDPHRIKGMTRMLIGMTLKALKSKVGDGGNEKEREALRFFEEGFDGFDPDALQELERFLLCGTTQAQTKKEEDPV